MPRSEGRRGLGAALDQAEGVVTLLRGVLGDGVLGVYLHGSAAVGRLHPDSDVDLFAVASRRTTEAERRQLIERLLPISGRGDPTGRSRSIDLEIVVQADVRPWRYPPRLEFQYGDWFRPEFARGNFGPWQSPDPDLTILLEMVLQADRPLLGPRPAELLDPIPPADLRRAMLDTIPALLSYLDGDERNVVLTFVRTWTTLATSVIRSKDAAADWALPLLPAEHRPVLEHARAIYLGDAPEEWGDLMPGVRPFVQYAIGEIERAAARTSGA
jgi:predicted nucleotidyltransferase